MAGGAGSWIMLPGVDSSRWGCEMCQWAHAVSAICESAFLICGVTWIEVNCSVMRFWYASTRFSHQSCAESCW
jgi:hypothetical protein